MDRAQEFAALPARTEDGRAAFHHCLTALVRTLGIDVDAVVDPDAHPEWTWEQRMRRALREALPGRSGLPEGSFDVLIKTAVHDPNPSFNRQFIEPAVGAFGRRRVQEALLHHLRTGTDQERASSSSMSTWT